MSFALVFGLIQLLLLMMMNPAAESRRVGRKSDVEEAASVEGSDATRAAAHLRKQSELVSRRRWFSSQLIPWNDHDMPWLKRSGHAGELTATDDDKRGWGNGIPPWMKHRVVEPTRPMINSQRR